MTFKPRLWFPIAVILSVANVVAVGFAGTGALHATSHAVLALGFGLWAQRLRQRLRKDDVTNEIEDRVDRFDALEADVTRLRQELSEAQERLDFTERLLAQRSEPRR
jgi:hypothetical protein